MSYKDRARAAGDGAAAIDALPCRRCHGVTALATLSTHGGLCPGCCAAYCRERPQYPPQPPDGVVPPSAGGRAWAYRLRWREQQGHPLTWHQREMWRAALRGRVDAIAQHDAGGECHPCEVAQ